MDARIRLGERIGRGGMAEVFAAQLIGPAGFAKDVAVKKLLPRFAQDPSFLERFLNEARMAARLSHPNIVQIFELGRDGHDHYIVMEAVRGASLRTVLARLEELNLVFPRGVAVHVAQALCAGLAHAHEQVGLIHRDVSPHNVLLSFDGGVKLIDFGIARLQQSDDRLTQVGQVLGKLRYMSPEQARGETIDARSDVFSAGIVLFAMLTRRLPFDGHNPDDIGQKLRRGQRARVRELASDVDPAVEAVIDRALQIDPKERYASARAMGAALAATKGGANVGAHDVEDLLRALFPDEATGPWPVHELEKRADGGEHTASVAPSKSVPLQEITISSEISDVAGGAPARGESGTGSWSPGLEAGQTAVLDAPNMNDTDPEQPTPQRERLQRSAPLMIAGGVALLVVVALLAVWIITRDRRSEAITAYGDAGPVLAVVDAGSMTAPQIVAGPQHEVAPTEPSRVVVEELVLDDPPDVDKTKPIASKEKKRAKVQLQKLVIETRPWTKVKIDGRSIGVTPLAVEVSVGIHRVLLENDETGVRRETEVRVTADEPAVLRLDLRK